MRLSDAILLGGMVTYPAAFYLSDGYGGHCALGAACVAIGEDSENSVLYRSWAWLSELAPIPCGCTHRFCRDGLNFPITDNRNLIAHLFNEHVAIDWTLEQLADYVRSIEPSDSPESVTNPQETSTEKVTL